MPTSTFAVFFFIFSSGHVVVSRIGSWQEEWGRRVTDSQVWKTSFFPIKYESISFRVDLLTSHRDGLISDEYYEKIKKNNGINKILLYMRMFCDQCLMSDLKRTCSSQGSSPMVVFHRCENLGKRLYSWKFCFRRMEGFL